MKKTFLVIIALLSIFPAKADEGMWFLMFIERLNHRDMQKMGLQLTAEEIYSINNIDNQVELLREDIAFISELLVTEAKPGELAQPQAVEFPTRLT